MVLARSGGILPTSAAVPSDPNPERKVHSLSASRRLIWLILFALIVVLALLWWVRLAG
jgi:hypothetical protein